jgi:hypothetical protein
VSLCIDSPQGLTFSLTGRFLGVSGLFEVPGGVSGQLVGMSLSLTTSFRAAPDGTMTVNVVNCSTVIQQSNFVLAPEGPLSTLVKTFEVRGFRVSSARPVFSGLGECEAFSLKLECLI